MTRLLAALLLLVPLAGCVSTGGTPNSPANPTPQQEDSERHRDLGAD